MTIPTAILVAWIHACAQVHGVDPAFAQAVAVVESRPKGGGMEMRVGPIGKSGRFVGPMGIAKCFENDADIYNPYINILIGVCALRGPEKKALRRYNASFDTAYYHEVMRIKAKLKKELQ